jgi:ABC-type nitrate/sulfonate/bicarbonate transport system ATPase subunit
MTLDPGADKKFLEIWQLKKSFATEKGPLVVVEDFNLTVQQGQFVSLIGHSGCGKSTVLSIVAGLTQGSGGTVILGGREVTGPGRIAASCSRRLASFLG